MTTASRRPWIALLLSLLMPGLGQAYCGRWSAGTMFYAVLLVLALLYRLPPLLGLGDETLLMIAGIGVVLCLAAALEAAAGARWLADQHGPAAFTRWYVLGPAILLNAGLVFCLAFLNTYRIPSASMSPTVIVGDNIMTRTYGFPFGGPARCDVAVFFHDEGNKRTYFIKRVVALEGDHVAYRNGHLVINDSPVAREKVSASPDGTIYRETLPGGCSYFILEQSDSAPLDNTDTFIVPTGAAFVLGDNRDDSMDSRAAIFGPVALEKFRGKAVFIANPAHPSRDGFLGGQ